MIFWAYFYCYLTLMWGKTGMFGNGQKRLLDILSVKSWNPWGLLDFIEMCTFVSFWLGFLTSLYRQKLDYKKRIVMQVIPFIKMQIVSCECNCLLSCGYGLVFPVLPLFVKWFQHFLSAYKCAVVWVLLWAVVILYWFYY